MKILSNHQHSMDWWDARQGRCTGSKVACVLSFLKRGEKKGGESADRANYKIKIVSEILSGAPIMDGFLTPAMQWGVDNESLARAAYEMRTGYDVTESGFVLHDNIIRFGGSPDGYIDADGLLEIKAPLTTTHVRWMLEGVVPEEHEPQMSAYLSITGRAWCDFVSFDPRLPEKHQLFIKRLHRDEARIAELEAGVVAFLDEVDSMLARLKLLNDAHAPKAKLRAELDASLGITDEDAPDWMREKMAEVSPGASE